MVQRWNLIKFSIEECWKVSKLFIFQVLLLKLVESFIPLISVWSMGEIVNQVTVFVSEDNSPTFQFYIVVVIQIMALFLSPVIFKIYDYMKIKVSTSINYAQKQKIIDKVIKIPHEEFENPEFHNYLGRVSTDDYGERIISPLDQLFTIFSAFITVSTMIYYTTSFNKGLIALALISTIPVYFIQRNLMIKNFNLYKNQTLSNRQLNYITGLFSDKASIKEIKLFQLHKWLKKRYSKYYWQLFHEKKQLLKLDLFQNTYLDLFQLTIYFFVFLLVINQVEKGTVLVGDFITIPQAFNSLQASMAALLTSFSTLLTSRFYLNDLENFLSITEMDDRNGEEFSFKEEIEVIDLNFSYPESIHPALKQINLSIMKNETIAILGENGSGKSTLIKCLTGLYQTYNGQILVDGRDINSISRGELFKAISVIFQDFIKYNFSIKENITVGKGINRFYDKEEEELQKIVYNTGVNRLIERLPKGINTILGNYFDLGTELSGGQWQKIALARALYKDAKILILDEPTSALDPKSEIEFFESLKYIARDKTIIFVTHRTGVAKMADRIILMDNGQIVEEGTHDELMRNAYLYSELYMKQQKLYGFGG